MNPLRNLYVVACLAVVVCASPSSRSNSLNNSLKPSAWLSMNELENLPAIDEITLKDLENMPAQDGADLVNKIYHLSQVTQDVSPNYTPNPNEIATYLVQPNGQKMEFNLNQLGAIAQQQPNFGQEEVTVFITGLPQQTHSVKKATRKIVEAYMQRYNGQQRKNDNRNNNNKNDDNRNNKQNNQNRQSNSDEEDSNESWQSQEKTTGNLIIIDLGDNLKSFKRVAGLDIERTGALLASNLVELTNKVPAEIVHVVAQGIASHVAGAAGRYYTRLTGHKLRRITALDPSKIIAKNPNILTGLARGDADFVDAIHTSAYGMGTPARVGDADFYPNGPSAAVPGADNVVEASMRATRYFAESVRPGNERNFPAVAANSLKQYKNNNGQTQRAYMGIATNYDVEGDYILQVNSKSPFGKSAPAQKQSSYHGAHQQWKMEQDD